MDRLIEEERRRIKEIEERLAVLKEGIKEAERVGGKYAPVMYEDVCWLLTHLIHALQVIEELRQSVKGYQRQVDVLTEQLRFDKDAWKNYQRLLAEDKDKRK